MGWYDLLEENQYLTEVNLEDLEYTSSKKQEHWQVAIQAAREDSRLQGLSLSQTDIHRRKVAIRGRVHTQL